MQTALPPTPASAMKIGVLAALGAVDRLFDEQSLRRLEFIRRLKTLGLSLEEIQSCLAIHDDGVLPCHDIQCCSTTRLGASSGRSTISLSSGLSWRRCWPAGAAIPLGKLT